MDNNTVFAWHTLVFSILRDILLGLALPIVKLFRIIQPLWEMLSNDRQCKVEDVHLLVFQGNNGKILQEKYMEFKCASYDCPTHNSITC